MIAVLISWMVIVIPCTLIGMVALDICKQIFKSDSRFLRSFDCILVMGIIVLTVYAEVISLFHKVGRLAWAGIFVLEIVCIAYLFVSWKKRKLFFKIPVISTWKWIGIVIMAMMITAWTSAAPTHYDTSLYHSQAIRWIEEYGVVPGLGNFHNRFAYNSSFFVLQALLSFRWLLNQSLHSVNGFLALLFSVYAIGSMSSDKKKVPVNFTKLVIILYVIVSAKHISSPSSDIPALLFTLWIQCRWLDLISEDEIDEVSYTFLCLVSVYAITVKLSTLTTALLIFFPLIILIKKRDWLKIVYSAIGCMIISLPFLTRNVIISGYMLYPYAQLDLFDVDWKMPTSVAEHDAMEIAVWGRGLNDVGKYHMPFIDWFPLWFQGIDRSYQVLFVVSMFSVVAALVYLVYGIWKKKEKPALLLLLGTEIIGMLFWLFSAPLIRYGGVSMIVLPCTLLYIVTDKLKQDKHRCWLGTVSGVVMYGCLSLMILCTPDSMGIEVLHQSDYENKPVIGVAFENQTIYIPEGEWRTGYEPFPSMLYPEQLNNIEMRGTDLADGFRIKEDKKNLHLMNDGYVW